MPRQLVFPFSPREVFDPDEFIVAPCNEQAYRFIERWPDWPARAAALYGPKGCGKSHLAMIWARIAGASEFFVMLPDAEVEEPSSEMHRAAGNHVISELPENSTALIEDVDSNATTRNRDAQIMSLLERPKTTVLFTGLSHPSAWPVAMNDLRSRFDSLIAFPMWAPDESLLSALVRKHFSARQLAVSENVVRRIVTHIERTPEAVAAFVARADMKALSEKRAVSERLVMDLIEAEEGSGG